MIDVNGNPKLNIVYQAYGSIENLHQSTFSIVSLLSKTQAESDFQICIYTDNEKYFKSVFEEDFNGKDRQIHIEVVTPDQLKLWRGKIDFVHRVKIEILIHAAKKWLGPIVYLDGDTFFHSDPIPTFLGVADNKSLMHIAESRLDTGRDPLSKKICKFVKKNQFLVDGEVIQIPTETVMWNAGVIGLSTHQTKLLPKILALTDEMHALYPKHVMEQLAVSYFLQANTLVKSCDALVGHYWNQKPEYNEAIREYLEKFPSVNQALEHLSDFRWPKPFEKKTKKTILSRVSKWIGLSGLEL